MIDFSMVESISLPEGKVKKIEKNNIILWEIYKYTNQVSISINTDGSIYNNGLGYKEGYRVRSGGSEVEEEGHICTGFIPFSIGDNLIIFPAFNGGNSWNAINFFDSNFNNLGQIVDTGYGYGICSELANIYQTTLDGEISRLTYSENFDSSIAYIRINHGLNRATGDNFIVTINEELS